MFCPKCGSLLVPKKDGNKRVLGCSCGYRSDKKEAQKINEKSTKKHEEILIIDKGELHTLPKMEAECPKCGNREARFWLVQTRAADEPETKFLKCTKCEHTWRDYD